MKKFWNTYKKWIIGLIVIVAVLYFVFGRSGKNDDTNSQTVVAQKGTLEEVVNITGRVKPSQEVNLSFERGGVVRSVNTIVGDVVQKGRVLASVSNGDAQGSLQEAQAGLDAAQATLDQLNRGARDEEKRIKQTAVESAKQDLANSYSNTPDTLRNVYTNASDAVRVKLSALFDGRAGSGYKLTFASCDSQSEIDATNLRLDVDTSLKNILSVSDTLNTSDQSTVDAVLKNTVTEMQKIDQFVRRTNDMLSVSCALSNRNLDAFRQSVTLAKGPLNAALSEISTKRNAIASQKLLVQRAENDLAITLSGTDEDKIRAQEAAVKQAQARVTQSYASISQTIIVAPFTGRITKVDAKLGQFAGASTPQIVMISDGAFEIEAKIPEVDVSRVKINNTASVWIEAFGKDTLFEAVVTKIDPAETVSDGVSTYKATLQFVEKDARIKSGMTANVDIVTSKKENTVSVPARAVQTGDKGRFVTVQKNDATEEVIIKQGTLGKNGEREITSGLVGGEVIVLPVRK